MLAIAGTVEALHSLRRSTAASRRHATTSAVISVAMALFLIGAPFVAAQALRLLIGGWFAVDAIRHAVILVRGRDRHEQATSALAVLGNLTVVLLLLFAHGWLLRWVVPIAGALRIFGIAWSIATAPVYSTSDADETVLDELGLADHPGAVAMATEVADAERARAPVDRAWTLSFIATLFAIHIGRMSTDLTLLGLLSPAVAVAGDMAIAVLFTLLVINPAYLMGRGPTRRIERWLWRGRQERPESPRTRGLEHGRPVHQRVAAVEIEDGDPDARRDVIQCRRRSVWACNVDCRLPPFLRRPSRSGA